SIAAPASTYGSVAIACSSLRLWLGWTVELGLRGRVALDHDRSGQPAALVVPRGRPVPVVTGAIEVEGGGALRVVDEPDELGVAVGRQDRAVRVLVVVDQRQLYDAAVG